MKRSLLLILVSQFKLCIELIRIDSLDIFAINYYSNQTLSLSEQSQVVYCIKINIAYQPAQKYKHRHRDITK